MKETEPIAESPKAVERLRANRGAARELRAAGALGGARSLRRQGMARSFARRRRLRNARVYLPPLVGALAVAAAGHPGPALVLAGGLLLVGGGMRGAIDYPLPLMTVTRFLLALVPGLVGLAAVGAVLVIPPEESDQFAREILPGIPFALATGLLIELGARRWLAGAPVRIAVLDDSTFAYGLRQEMKETGIDDFELVGWLDTRGRRTDPSGGPKAETLRAVIASARIELVVRGRLAGHEADRGASYDEVAEALIDLPVRMIDGNQLYEKLFGHVPMGVMDASWYLYLMHPRYQATQRLPMRIFDLAVSVPLALFVLPLVAISALALKLEDRGSPALFRQLRVGEEGEPFEILKLRTMRMEAGPGAPAWSGGGDGRVTPVGKVLRRLHLDELPQLLNVLRGEMSLVGPRPEQPEMVEELKEVFPHYERRHLIKPGVTGWAQIRCGYAGSTLGTAWKVCHDLFYFKHRNVLTNVVLIIETVVIAAKDSHRPLRVPGSQFLFGRELGLEIESPERIEIGDLREALNAVGAGAGVEAP